MSKRTIVQPNTQPDWPTAMKGHRSNGMLLGTNGSVWLAKKVPMSPIVDAKADKEAFNSSAPLARAFEELSLMASNRMNRRNASRSTYRRFQILTVNTPQLFRAAKDHPLRKLLNDSFGSRTIDRRVCLFLVQLRDSIGDGTFASAKDSVLSTLSGNETPLADFDKDFTVVNDALTRSGMKDAKNEEIRLANAWWNHGTFPDTPMLPHGGHLHVFTSESGMRVADESGRAQCEDWPDDIGQHAVSFLSVQDFDFDDRASVVDPEANWASQLINSGALAISIRGLVEPAKLTRAELRRNRKRFLDDINERKAQGTMDRTEQNQKLEALEMNEAIYSSKNAPPTLVDTSVIAAFDGIVDDPSSLNSSSTAVMNSMLSRQPRAMAETWLCSSHNANPHLHDLPAHVISSSGVNNLSRVGDKTGALVGFTERDNQPALLSPVAASRGDQLPNCLVAGATGSGKTQSLLWLAHQFAEMGQPQIIVDPKDQSDHTEAVEASGGQVVSLDRLQDADGVFDPLRFAASVESGIDLAASMLIAINPWGDWVDNYETPLHRALRIGVEAGARCIGEALIYARDHDENDRVPADMVQKVFDLAESSPMFRACVGVDPQTAPLRVASGITLIKVGDAHLELPPPGLPPQSQGQRIAVQVIRMMVFGSAMALTGRQGVLHLDEAWTFLTAGATEVERLGRLARSQEVLPMLYTQKISDAVDADISGYISRGLIMSIEDEIEARAACQLFKLEPTAERIRRITAKGTLGDLEDDEDAAPNFDSLKPLRLGEAGEVIRGAVALYSDLSGARCVPTVVDIPPWFFEKSSTNPVDIARRRDENRRKELEASSRRAF